MDAENADQLYVGTDILSKRLTLIRSLRIEGFLLGPRPDMIFFWRLAMTQYLRVHESSHGSFLRVKPIDFRGKPASVVLIGPARQFTLDRLAIFYDVFFSVIVLVINSTYRLIVYGRHNSVACLAETQL